MKKNYFFDMDLTLFIFPVQHGEMGTKKYRTQAGFFSKLKPYKNIELINELAKNGENVYILSNSPTDTADSDKMESIRKYLPDFDENNVIFNRGGLFAAKTKALVAMEILGRELTENDILFDDTIQNLFEWTEAGGTAIKKQNRKDKETTWKGLRMARLATIYNKIQLQAI